MKVKTLIDELSKLNPELEVMVARDEEGNGFNTVEEVYKYWLDYDNESIFDDTDYEHYLDETGRHDEFRPVAVFWP